MITREDIFNAGGKKKNKKYDIYQDCWTKESFYIFVKDDYKFLGRKPEAKDFIQQVSIKIKGVVTRPGLPLWITCKSKDYSYGIMKDENEIWKTSEEIEQLPEMQDYLNSFLEKHKFLLENKNQGYKTKITEYQSMISNNKKNIEIINSL